MFFTIQSSPSPIWEGEVLSITSENREGSFTILPDHANFMTPIEAVPIIVTLPDGTTHTYEFDQSVLFLQDNHVKLFVHDNPSVVE
jgi:F0F1-type ATP synthase epsilon subunit